MKPLNPKFIKLVQLLNDKRFHDGTFLGEQLHISRMGVWKMIKKLQAYGIEVSSEKGRGYLLKNELILLDDALIKNLLKKTEIEIKIFEKINSTNDYFKNNSEKLAVCLAELQTQGRGRFQRSWYSPFGQNIYFSLCYPFNKEISALSGLSLVVGVSVCQAIESVCQLPKSLQIKWPNDIVSNGKKLAGTLVEFQAQAHGAGHATIGIGINVNMLNDTNQISQDWTSIRKLTSQYQDRNSIVAVLISQLIANLDHFKETGLDIFLSTWQARDSLRGKNIVLKNNKIVIRGEALGINNRGYLLIKSADNKITAFSTGDTTLIKDK